jgi:hypothetical protein
MPATMGDPAKIVMLPAPPVLRESKGVFSGNLFQHHLDPSEAASNIVLTIQARLVKCQAPSLGLASLGLARKTLSLKDMGKQSITAKRRNVKCQVGDPSTLVGGHRPRFGTHIKTKSYAYCILPISQIANLVSRGSRLGLGDTIPILDLKSQIRPPTTTFPISDLRSSIPLTS